MADGASVSVVQCPECGKQGKWNPNLAGKKLKCRCGASFIVPASAADLTKPHDPFPKSSEEALYDLAPAIEIPAKPDIPVPSAAPQQPPAQVLNYQGQAPPERPPRAGQIAVDDLWEGNKTKNLFFPITLILASVALNFFAEAFYEGTKSAGATAAAKDMAISLAIQIPVMLLGCILAVHWLDTTFGPLLPAILKLSSIALTPDALWAFAAVAGASLGVSNGLGTMIVGGFMGWLIGFALGSALYYWLFVFYFSMDLRDALRLTLLTWAFRVTAELVIEIIKNR